MSITKAVWKTYRAGVPVGRGAKVHAMKSVAYADGTTSIVGFFALCGVNNTKTTLANYDDTAPNACRRCHNLRGTE
jgi:hypothetical protein